MNSPTMTSTDLTKRWEDALLLEGGSGLTDSMLSELAEYFHISRAEAQGRCERAEWESKREWESTSRSRADDVLNFYDTTQSYIFEHMWWHAVHPWPSANIAVLDYGLRHHKHLYLDFGSGVGANGIVFARNGFDVTLADVSRTMLDFARWRLERRGLRANYVYLRDERLPQHHFDLVTAVDVMEHVVNPARELKRLSNSMVVGGALVFNCLTGKDPDKPMHIVHSSYDLYRGMRAAGFRPAPSESEQLSQFGLEVVTRGAQGALDDLLCGIYDRYKYSVLADTYWAMKQRLLQYTRNPRA